MAGKKEKKDKKDKAEEAPESVAEGEEGEAAPKKKLSGKTLILFIVLPAVLVLGGGGAAAMMLLGGKKEVVAEDGEHAADGEDHAAADKKGAKKKDEKKKDEHGAAKDSNAAGAEGEGTAADVGKLIVGEEGNPSYYEVPKIIVNLAGNPEERPLLLELELVLESTKSETFDEVPALMPRLRDQVQTFLRELRVEDLNGSAGTYRLRLELLKRFNLVMAPQKVDAVLIEGILVQ
jgi:flagellar protein FliL